MAPVTGSDSAVVLAGSDEALFVGNQRILFDLDGVLILGEEPIASAPEVVEGIRAAGVEIRFVTNNASRPPVEVAQLLARAGFVAQTAEVVTSAMAAASLLATRHPTGAPVLVVGGEGVRAALSDSGLRPVDSADDHPVAVMQGFSADVGWRMLAEAAIAIRRSADWVATNLDRTLPSPRGPLPGNGSLVALLETATGRRPESVGKPAPALYDAALGEVSRDVAIAVGDRLDTDIAGARAAGLRSVLVLTGVSSARDLVAAPAGSRPDFIGRDLDSLRQRHAEASFGGDRARCGAVTAEVDAGEARLVGDVESGPDGLDGLRALCALAWSIPRGQLTGESYDRALQSLDLN